MNRERLAELFEQAIGIRPEDLAQWLDQNCGEDEALRTELDRLLRADAKAAQFMDKPPLLVAQAAAASAASTDMPQTFGVWRVLRSLGSGGMGEVWLAERSDGEFEQRVAIKQLAWPTPGLLQRFRQERQILARLEHPNIARLIDGGVDAAGAPYLVMEYVEGRPIIAYVRAHALDLRARLNLFLHVCEGVQYAHQNLIVHRDLKPSNIFVTDDGLPKLLDFGIAKVLATTDDGAQTQTAARMLTPDYAAPEQFSGGAITTSTDVYALGVVLYELLADVRPRRARVDPAQATTETLPPSSAVDRAIGNAGARRRALRGDLDRIALKALAPDPQHRYSSAEALGSDIRRYLDGRPIMARGDSAWYRFRKYARRNRYVLAAATIAFAVCLAAAFISLHQASMAREQAQRATAVREFLAGVFANANPDENRGKPITAHQLLEKGEQQLAREAGAQTATEADIAALLARLYRDLGDRPRAHDLTTRALARSENARVPADVRAHVLLAAAAMESEDKNTYERALVHARQALALLDSATDKDWKVVAEAHRLIALCMIETGKYADAAIFLQKTLPTQAIQAGARSEALADEHVLLGRALGELARFDEAQTAFDAGITMLRELYGDDSNRLAYALNQLGSMLYGKGDFARAAVLHRQVLDIHRATLGPDHHNTFVAAYNLLGDIEAQGHFAQALPQRLALIERRKSSTETTPVEKAQDYDGLAVDYRELGRFDEAVAMSRQAISLLESSQGPDSSYGAGMLRHLGLALAMQGHYTQAESAFRDALAIRLKHGPATSFGACGVRHDIGNILRQQHRYAQAIHQLQALGKDACLVGLTDTDPWRPKVLANLSQAQLDSGLTSAADSSARQALAYGRKALRDHYELGLPLFATARVALALEHAGEAEPLLREALALRSTVHPADDPRILEVKVALVNALMAQRKNDEARIVQAEIEPLLKASSSPYAAELRQRLVEK